MQGGHGWTGGVSGSGKHIGTAQGQAREVNEWVALGVCGCGWVGWQ